ncbi:MAG TPA: 2,3-bisphosphoglycerate-independent phosphoglycerate mutase [Firmicutes bacterium]|nr:2,3-bisphosphoglycerate-independent phosphoglycerate mutase [Bacillota bacterium]
MLLLVIFDGWGISSETKGNAIYSAKTFFMDMVNREFPGRAIFAHGEYVGLPKGQMGNSEVGHLNIGGGRRIRPDLVVINDLIESGDFFKNQPILELIDKVKTRGGRLHLMGLLSDGGIHSHIRHLESLLKLIDSVGGVPTFLHAYLDGRDTEPKVADKFIRQAQELLDSHPEMYFRTIGGRSWGMDRDKYWSRIETHYKTIVSGDSPEHAKSAIEAVDAAFARGETDEFVTPVVIDLPEGIDGCVRDGDGVIHFNFRADRAIQMTRALTDTDFNEFNVGKRPEIDMVTFTMYDEYLNVKVAFEGEILHDTLTEVICRNGGRVFKIAETEKWAHVTKFFNGGQMEPFECEERQLVQSPLDVRPHYDKKPEMSACEIAENLIPKIREGEHDLIIVNFANPDMVGHTGVLQAAIAAVQTVDKCAWKVYEALREAGGTMIVTADHGNCEEMLDGDGCPATKHSTNPVPFFVLDRNVTLRKDEASLRDIAPTILHLMGFEKPEAMTGTSIVE